MQALVESTGHALFSGADGHQALQVRLQAVQAWVELTLHTAPEESSTRPAADATIVGVAASLQGMY